MFWSYTKPIFAILVARFYNEIFGVYSNRFQNFLDLSPDKSTKFLRPPQMQECCLFTNPSNMIWVSLLILIYDIHIFFKVHNCNMPFYWWLKLCQTVYNCCFPLSTNNNFSIFFEFQHYMSRKVSIVSLDFQ